MEVYEPGTMDERNDHFTIKSLGKYISEDVNKKLTRAIGLDKLGASSVSGVTVARPGDVKAIYKEKNIWTGLGPVDAGWKPMVPEVGGVDPTSTRHGWSDVINSPFQFNANDDVRSIPYYPNLGRVYNKDIRTNFPIVVFEPGRIKYPNGLMDFVDATNSSGGTDLKSFVRGDKRNLVQLSYMKLKGMFRLLTDTVKRGVFGTSFPSFEADMKLFKIYVNEMMIELATMLNLINPSQQATGDIADINDRLYDAVTGGGDIDSYQGDENNHGYIGSIKTLNLLRILPGRRKFGDETSHHGNFDYIPFLAHKGFSVSESISNSTEGHPLASKINEMASESSAAQAAGGLRLEGGSFVDMLASTVKGKISDGLKKASGNDLIAATAGDSRMLYPDIWSNSSFSRSYSMSFKFESPYGDTLSIFENVYIPFLIIYALGSPRQVGKSTYTSPFAIRCSSKGWFSCPFGFFESVSIERGDDKNNWTKDNLPRSIKVNVSLKDLVPNMMMSMSGGVFASLHSYNLGMREYMATLGGLSIKEKNNIGDQFDRFWTGFKASMSSKFDGLNVSHSLSESFISKPFTTFKKNHLNNSPY